MAEEPEDDELEAYLRSSLSERRRSRWGRQSLRRGSSPFLTEAMAAKHGRRLSSFTTSSGDDTAVSIEEEETPEEVKENMRLNKQIIETIKLQPWRMKKKYKILRKAKQYVKKNEGELAQSKRSKDVFAKYTLLWSKGLNRFKREIANLLVMMTPWEMRIKRIESHFGSVVASYFTFLRWVFWINCIISAFVCCFLMVPEVLRGAKDPTGMRKEIESDEAESALNLKAIWEFEGYLKYSPIFYGYYSNQEKTEEGYRVPLAYFLTSLCVYIFSFFAILRRMAENSRMSKLSEKDDECTFAWKLFTGWDYMIGNPETAYNKVASLVMSFKEAILEEKEKKKEIQSWKIITIRVAANFAVFILLMSSAYAVVLVVTRSQEPEAQDPNANWYRQNEVTVVVTGISAVFPNLFEVIGVAERYHPRIQLRWQLARILLLYLLNLYTLIFALFVKVYKTTDELAALAKNITEVIDAEKEAAWHGRSLLMVDEDLAESSTLLSPYNCTYIVIYNCTLAALYAGVNLTDSSSTSTFPSNATVDGDYFLDNSTSEEELFYGSMVGSIANLTAHGMVSWNISSSAPSGPHLALPPVFYNSSSAVELEDGKMVWDIPLDYVSEPPDNFTFFDWGGNFSTLDTRWSTTENDTTTLESTTSDDSSFTEPSELNCTVVIPVCTALPTTTEDGDTYPSTTEGLDGSTFNGTEDIDVTLNGTESAENATSERPCPGLLPDPNAPCPRRCMDKDKAYRIPTQDELVQVSEDIKEVLRKKCWETAFGQELVKLTVMDLVMTVLTTVIFDFIRAVFVRYANNCWCWDLEKGFPGYADFKIAENILHLVNNQGLVWMGMFFSPGLPAINTVKLCILVYVRSWAVLTANIPHETVFRASRSNNFYFALLLIMLFLCTLPVGFACVWLQPSWHCGPFSEQRRIFNVLTSYVLGILPEFMVEAVQYLTSPGVVIPLLLLMVLIIYYLVSLTGSLREANNDLKLQLRREKGEKEKPPKSEEKPPETVEIPDPISKWSTPKKILPLAGKFKAPGPLLDDESDDSNETPKKKSKRLLVVGDPFDEHYEGAEEKKAHRDDHKDRFSRRPSPMSSESHPSSSDGERHWIRRGGITGNGDLPLITISQASEGRDSPGQLSSLNSSEEGTPPSSALSRRRPGLIPSVSEQEEDDYVDQEDIGPDEDDASISVTIQDHTHFEPIKDSVEEANGEQGEMDMKPETVAVVRDHAETKALTGCAPGRLRHMDSTSLTDQEYEEYCKKSTLPLGNHRDRPQGRAAKPSPLQRSEAVKGSDSQGSSDSNVQRPPSPEVKYFYEKRIYKVYTIKSPAK